MINRGEYFNNETGRFEHKFKNKVISDSMKTLHLNDFNKEMAQGWKQQAFIEKESNYFIKRPAHLESDSQSTFLEVREQDKIAYLYKNWEYLNSYNCWASSRWEYAFLWICWSWVWSTVYIAWIFPYSYLRPYANICIVKS